jgi:hypothetical protein
MAETQHAKVQASDVAAIADLGLDRRRVAEWRDRAMANIDVAERRSSAPM